MQLLGGPMSLNQLKDWAKKVDSYTPSQRIEAWKQLNRIDPHEPRRVWGH